MLRGNSETTPSTTMISRRYKAPQMSLQMTKTGASASGRKKGKGTDEGCTHCGNPKHTRETCFKIHGYLEWWKDLKKNRETNQNRSTSRVSLATRQTTDIEFLVPSINSDEKTIDFSTDPGNKGCSLYCSHQWALNDWIIDSRATDHMIFYPKDFVEFN